MESRILSILTRTPLHVGAGSSVGAIDMPVQRDRHTQIPIIPGSGLKGVLRDLWNDDLEEQQNLFGPAAGSNKPAAGELVIGEGRCLCFPVRSAKGSFAWITCALALERYGRERGRGEKIHGPADESCHAADEVCIKGSVVLEEYAFQAEPLPEGTTDLLKGFLPDDSLVATLGTRLVLVSDGIYSHFCANACEVQQRIRIDDETGVVQTGALFNQENVPSDTLFYAVVGARRQADAIEKLGQKLDETGKTLQIGGDESVGLGYCSVFLQGGLE